MISLGIAILPDIVEQRSELEVTTLLRAETELSGDGERKSDHAAGVLAGIAVVGFDDVAEHQRRAPIGVAELKQTRQALVALVGEHREKAEQRHEREHRDRCVVDCVGGEQADRRERPRRSRTPTSRAAARTGSLLW